MQNLHRKCPRTSLMILELSDSIKEYKLVKRGRICEYLTVVIPVAVSSLHLLKQTAQFNGHYNFCEGHLHSQPSVIHRLHAVLLSVFMQHSVSASLILTNGEQ